MNAPTDIETRIAAALAQTKRPDVPDFLSQVAAQGATESVGQTPPGGCHLLLLLHELRCEFDSICEKLRGDQQNQALLAEKQRNENEGKAVTQAFHKHIRETFKQIEGKKVLTIYGDWQLAEVDDEPILLIIGPGIDVSELRAALGAQMY